MTASPYAPASASTSQSLSPERERDPGSRYSTAIHKIVGIIDGSDAYCKLKQRDKLMHPRSATFLWEGYSLFIGGERNKPARLLTV
jgi:hypothetical protein